MKPIDDGGPAFPRVAADPNWGQGTESYVGMSLMDYFAGLAMQGYNSGPEQGLNSDKKAAWSYDDAAAMLAERAKRRETGK